MIGIVFKKDRLQNSTSGNPRWKITFTDGRVLTTACNSFAGFTVPPVGSIVNYDVGNHGEIVTLETPK